MKICVHCHIGSLEMTDGTKLVRLLVHCHIGSLEMQQLRQH